jgi:hypothetical protein
MFQKRKRIVSEETLSKFRNQKCIICDKKSDPCHIKSIGSGGDDVENNLISLCRSHHIIQHQIGWAKFCLRNPKVYDELIKKGWIFKDNRLIKK